MTSPVGVRALLEPCRAFPRGDLSFRRRLLADRIRQARKAHLGAAQKHGRYSVQAQGYIRELDGYLHAAMTFDVITGKEFIALGKWVSSWERSQ